MQFITSKVILKLSFIGFQKKSNGGAKLIEFKMNAGLEDLNLVYLGEGGC